MLERFRAHPEVAAFAAAYYVALITVAAATGASQTVFYTVLMPLLFGGVAWFDARRPFSSLVLWGLVLWGLLHMIGGLVPATGGRVVYEVWLLPVLRFDHVVHAIGFGFAGLAFHEYQRPAAGAGAALALIGGVGFGGLNEMIEFLISRVVDDTNIGGFENTGWDLVANFVGASAAAMWLRASG